MEIRYLGGLPEIEGPVDTEIKSDSEYMQVKRPGLFKGWLKIARPDVISVRYMPNYGDARASTGTNLVTGALLGVGAALPALVLHHIGKEKKSLIMLQVRTSEGIVFDVMFEAKKGEKTYNEFVRLFR